jgi:hypothetical protein
MLCDLSLLNFSLFVHLHENSSFVSFFAKKKKLSFLSSDANEEIIKGRRII